MNNFDTSFLRSKVARRIFLLFVVCALLPITALATISYTQVTGQLKEQSRIRLRQASKAVGMSIYERLLLLEAEMKVVSRLYAGGGPAFSLPSEEFSKNLRDRFISLALIVERGKHISLFGRFEDPPQPTQAEHLHLGSGKTVIFVQHPENGSPRIVMSLALDSYRPERGVLLGEVNPAHLWVLGDENTLPPMTELCVLDQSYKVLICSFPEAVGFPEQVGFKVFESSSGEFEWSQKEEQFLASFWSIPLKFGFFVPQWTVVLFESKAGIFAPMAHFKKIFPLIMLMFLGIVSLLSITQIKRILIPLEKLQEGTQRIAMKDFTSRVTVSSGDELEELAKSFNMMADQLGTQFKTLATMADIDRAILSVLDAEKIVTTVLARMRDVLPCDALAMTLTASDNRGKTYTWQGNPGDEIAAEAVTLTLQDVQKLCDNRQSLSIASDYVPAYLAPLARQGCRSFLNLPIFFMETLSAIISLGYIHPPLTNDETLMHARQIADQAAIGISNAQLYQQIEKQAADLEKANKVKDEFLSVMSHELRTPLNVVSGYTGMVLDGMFGELNQEQAKALGRVMSRAHDLLVMTSGILEATRIETGEVRLGMDDVNLTEVMDELRLKYDFPLDKEIALSWDYPSDLPVIRTDSGKLKQILENLISNALKFTDKGSVTISARHATEKVEFRITDTGIGIPKSALPLIFEKFRQLDSSDTRPYEGIGLGLYIVKKFTDLLRGKIEVESEVGKGSSFSVTLPYS